MLALNETYIDLEEKVNLKLSDELAVIPPLSGGWVNTEVSDYVMELDFLEVTEKVISIEETSSLVGCPSAGATSIFVGK